MFIQVGQALMAIVPPKVWVIANFKKTRSSGTGSCFSLLPPENATGNFVKVVQRIPVKIVFDEPPDPAFPVAPGMSMVPDVRVR